MASNVRFVIGKTLVRTSAQRLGKLCSLLVFLIYSKQIAGQYLMYATKFLASSSKFNIYENINI